MTRPPAARVARRALRWVSRRLHARRRHDDGFILLESMIAITVITIVMGAVGVEFVGSLAATTHLRTRQTAVQIASSTVDRIRALHPSDLLTGRDADSVRTQFTDATPAVARWLTSMEQASDPTLDLPAGSGARADVPTDARFETPDHTRFQVDQYLGTCSIPRNSPSADQACVKASSLGADFATATPYLRAVVAVSWVEPRCPDGACVFVTSTLVSTRTDPTFRVNTSLPNAPVIAEVSPAPTTVAGDTVTPLQLTVQNRTGVPTYTWTILSGALPDGLSLSTTGIVSGTVSPGAGTSTATIQVTDGFARTDTRNLTWTVTPALSVSDPGAQASPVGATTSLTLGATGGSGSPYVFTVDPDTLPTGLSASSGTIAGTPTTAGVWTVRVRVSDDGAKHTADGTFTWTVRTPVAPTTPATQTNTVDAPIAPLTLSATGGDGTYVWTDPDRTLPSGLYLSSGGVVSGTPGTVSSDRSARVRLTVTDPTAGRAFTTGVVFTWHIVAKPSVTVPISTAEVTLGDRVDVDLPHDCPNAPCTFQVLDGPPGLSIDDRGRVSGYVGGTPTTYPHVAIRVTDHQGVSATSSTLSLTVKPAPIMIAVSDQSVSETATPSIPIRYSCPTAPCTIDVTGPAEAGAVGLGLSKDPVSVTRNSTAQVQVSDLTGQVYVNGLVARGTGSAAGTRYQVQFGITGADGFSPTRGTTTFTVYSTPTISTPGVVSQSREKSVSQSVGYTCPDTSCTVAVSGLPDGVVLSQDGSSSADSTTSVVVTTGSGTLHLAGQISTSAEPRDYLVTLTMSGADASATPTVTSTGLWTVR